MKTALFFKNGELAGYPSDLLIDGQLVKSYNLLFECEVNNINLLVGKSLSSELIKALKDKGVTFLKIKSLDELEGLDLNVALPDSKRKRGWGCSKSF
jgi:hypothetical protein